MAADYSKILLDESEMPTQWYNIIPDLPTPPPPVSVVSFVMPS